MSTQTICVSLDENNNLVCTGEGGFCGEHNAQLLEITLSGDFASDGYDYLRLAFDTGGLRGTSFSNPVTDSENSPVYRIDNKMYCPLVQGLTASGSLKIQLCAYSDTQGETTAIKKSGILELTFRPSIAAETEFESSGAGLAERVEAALSLVSALSAEVAFLRDNAVTEIAAGDYITLTNGVISADYTDRVNGQTQALVTTNALREYLDETLHGGFWQMRDILSAAVVATIVGKADANCLDVFIGMGETVLPEASVMGHLDELMYDPACADKYILIVTATDVENYVLSAAGHNYYAGKIYKVNGDSDNYTENVTQIEPSGFAALLSAVV